MKDVQISITDENFSEAWNYVNEKLAEVKKKKIIRMVLAVVSNIVFLMCISLMTYGALHRIKVPSFLEYLDSLKVFHSMWNIIRPLVDYPELNMLIQIVIYLLGAYVITLLVCGSVFAGIWYLYNPPIRTTDAEDLSKDSKELFMMSKELKFRSRKVERISSGSCSIIYTAEILLIIGMYVKTLVESSDFESIEIILKWVMGNVPATMLNSSIIMNLPLPLLTAMVAFYIMMYSGLSKILKLFYTTKVSESIYAEVERYYYECNIEVKKEFEEEESILARAKEIEAKRREEQKAFEDEMKKVNPIYKKIKIGFVVVTLLCVIGLIGWFTSKVDIKSILEDMNTEITTESEML